MLYALVSDIHANLTAWKAVLEDLTAMKARRIICLGDVVGYGPEPAATLESVYRHVDDFVMGNHDAVACGKMSSDSFNDHAKEMIQWSSNQLPARARAFLGEQPLTLDSPRFVCVHGSLDHPQAFNYILTPEEAVGTWQATEKQIVFIGHTHIPAIYVIGHSGNPHLIPSQDFQLEAGKRYIVNPGSVGDPRDNDPRSSYCLFDDKTGNVIFRRVPFDYESVRKATITAGLDIETIPLLQRDPVSKRETVRESLGFAPPEAVDRMAQDVAHTGYIGSLKKSNKRLKIAIFTSVTAFMAALGTATALWMESDGTDRIAFPVPPLEVREAVVPSDLGRNLLPSIPAGDLSRGGVIEGWRYELSDPDKQHVSIRREAATGKAVLEITNDERLPFTLTAPDWKLNGLARGRVRAIARATRRSAFSGTCTITVTANRNDPDEMHLLSLPVSIGTAGSWSETKRITDSKNRKTRLTGKTKTLSYRLDADFSGELHLTDLQLLYVPDAKPRVTTKQRQ